MLNNLRELRDLKKIKTVLNDCKKFSYPFMLWQNVNKKRIQALGKIIQTNYKDNIFVELESDFAKNINAHEIVFLFQEKLNLVFKGFIKSISDNSFILQLEPKLFLEEKRDNPRFDFLKLQFFAHMEIEYKGSKKKLSLQLENISQCGMCICANLKRKDLLKKDSKINLIGIESIQFPMIIQGKIVHITISKNDLGQAKLFIGVSFDKKSPIIQEVITSIEVKAS